MNYNEALAYIHGTLRFGSKLGLHNISVLLELMGNPHHKLKYVHIAGTNGKGSTTAFISSILIEAGYRVGMFTSPYLQRFTERIKINNQEIHQEALARITDFVKSKVDEMTRKGENHPTEFEIVTAIAFQYYMENNCDIVVLEVGLGGRYDSTNVIDSSLVSVITTISFDHMEFLGDTLPKIAYEKAGIIKEHGSVVLYPQQKDVEDVVASTCKEKSAKLHKFDFDCLKISDFHVSGQEFSYNGYKNLKISMIGEHQAKNAVTALKAIELLRDKGYKIQDRAVREGLLNARWSGRLEIVNSKPLFLIDAAHNTQGAKTLYDALVKYFPNKRIIFIFGMLKDKDYISVIETVAPIARCFITVTPDSIRALPAEELAIFAKRYCNNVSIGDTIDEAVSTSLQIASDEDVICAFGSLYYIGRVRDYFKMS